tara:strand:- start:249 stop:1202 length:954 start_codon:yes stop_codon:yes gene_type:complete
MVINRKPAIISIAGYKLTKQEVQLLKKEKPWGVILFKRNIFSFQQTKKLTKQIRKCFNDRFYPILIDEEGGKVSRLSNLFNTREFSQYFFGNLYEINKKKGLLFYRYYLETICNILNESGINVNTIPVMDLLQNSTHQIIKERSYSANINTIKSLGKLCISFLKEKKIAAVAKHAPGHGCANSDSHKKLPVVRKELKHLYSTDFLLFRNLNCHFLMTAHVLYKKIDANFPATHSKKIIKQIIRKKLNFKGLIISDDISMKALSKDLVLNAKEALNSGCNLVLYCNGKIQESRRLLKNLEGIDKFTQKKTHQFYQFLR